jgi:hypothetical protein
MHPLPPRGGYHNEMVEDAVIFFTSYVVSYFIQYRSM